MVDLYDCYTFDIFNIFLLRKIFSHTYINKGKQLVRVLHEAVPSAVDIFTIHMDSLENLDQYFSDHRFICELFTICYLWMALGHMVSLLSLVS